MKDITCSKLFVSSSRKDKILAAIQDPNNLELVKQVAEYLDDEFIDKKYLNPETDTSVNNTDDDITQDGSSTKLPSSGKSGGLGGGYSSSGFSSMDDIFDDDSEGSDELQDEGVPSDDPSQSDPEVKDDPTVDSSKRVTASIVLDVVKGTLNARTDTAGVDRVVEKDSELWVYYNDSVNLNKVMSEAAQELLLNGYSMLEFNRLARSNNAIVFDVVNKSSSGGV